MANNQPAAAVSLSVPAAPVHHDTSASGAHHSATQSRSNSPPAKHRRTRSSKDSRSPSPPHSKLRPTGTESHPITPRSTRLPRYNARSPQLRTEGLARLDFSEIDIHRSRFIDDWVLRMTTEKHITQIVILAGSLSSSRGQVDLPESVAVWEVDFPEAIKYKENLLYGGDVDPKVSTSRHGADLTKGGWLEDLKSIGLNTSLPIAWIIEGLLIYFSADEVDDLLDLLWRKSARGSVLCCDFGYESRQYAGKVTKAFLSRSEHMRAFIRNPTVFMAGMGWDAVCYIYKEKEQNYNHLSANLDPNERTHPHIIITAERRDGQLQSKKRRALERKRHAAERALGRLAKFLQPEVLQPINEFIKAVEAAEIGV